MKNKIQQKIVEFLKKNPKPNDEKFHKFVESLKVEHSVGEQEVYKMLGEFLSGGKSKGKADKVDPKELAMGIKVELEHTNNKIIAEKIARDHLAEHKNYYTELIKMEKNLEAEKPMKKSFIKIFDNLYVPMDKAKSGGSGKGHKYYKRVPKATGKGYNYYYTKEQYQQATKKEVPEKAEKKGSVFSSIMSFFGFKDEKQAKEKVSSLYTENKEQLAGVDKNTFANYMSEYLSNKDKWDKKLQKKEVTTVDKKTKKIEKKKTTDKKAVMSQKGKNWNVSIMRKVAGIVGGVKGQTGDVLGTEKGVPKELNILADVVKKEPDFDKSFNIINNMTGLPKETTDKFFELFREDEKGHTRTPKEGWQAFIDMVNKDKSPDNFGTMPEGEGGVSDKQTQRLIDSETKKIENDGGAVHQTEVDGKKYYIEVDPKYGWKGRGKDVTVRDENWIPVKTFANKGGDSKKNIIDMVNNSLSTGDKTGIMSEKGEKFKEKSLKDELNNIEKYFEQRAEQEIILNKLSKEEAQNKLKDKKNNKLEEIKNETKNKFEKFDNTFNSKDINKIYKLVKNNKLAREYFKEKYDINFKYHPSSIKSAIEKTFDIKSERKKNEPEKTIEGSNIPEKFKDKSSSTKRLIIKSEGKKYYTVEEPVSGREFKMYKNDEIGKLEQGEQIYLNVLTNTEYSKYGSITQYYPISKETPGTEKKPRTKSEIIGDGTWNNKVYGRKGAYSIYVNGNKKSISDSDAKTLENNEINLKKSYIKVGENKYIKLIKAGKPVPSGTLSKDGKKKKMPDGSWKPVTQPKDTKKKPESKDKKKLEATPQDSSARDRLKNTLKKMASILADALSGRDTVQPTGAAVEQVGENLKGSNAKKPDKKKPEKKKPVKTKKEPKKSLSQEEKDIKDGAK